MVAFVIPPSTLILHCTVIRTRIVVLIFGSEFLAIVVLFSVSTCQCVTYKVFVYLLNIFTLISKQDINYERPSVKEFTEINNLIVTVIISGCPYLKDLILLIKNNGFFRYLLFSFIIKTYKNWFSFL